MVRKGVGGLIPLGEVETMLGIDVSQKELCCVLVDAVSRKRLWQKSVPNTEEGWQALLASTPKEVPWVMEPTGRYSTGVAREAKQQGRNVLLAEPRQARSYLVSMSPRAKTDPLDAYGLALFGLSKDLAAYPVPSDAMDRLRQMLSARKGLSQSITRLTQQARELPLAQENLLEAAKELKERRKAMDTAIAADLAQSGYAALGKRLMGVPGIGPVTAASVIVRLGERRFESAEKFVAYVGLDITVHQSGKSQGVGHVSHHGDAEMRRLFYLAAQSNLRIEQSPFRHQYEREREKGMSSTAALCAVSRKIAKLCWSLVKHGATYDPQRLYCQAPNPKTENSSPTP